VELADRTYNIKGQGMSTEQDPSADKVGEALNAQRFQMLEDIAIELAGNVVFPTSFDAALRLRKELQNPDLPTARIATIVGFEPLVASKLLTLANSVLYSPDGTPARDLRAAISRLGVDLVRTTALGIAMGQLLRSKEMVVFTDLAQALWLHSLKTATAARLLARTHTKIKPDEAMLAGLVHDLGAFYMLYRAAQYPELRMRPDTVRYLIIEWHENIGVTLLNALGLPEEIIDATADHDLPRSGPVVLRNLSDIVYVANILAGTRLEWADVDNKERADDIAAVSQEYADLLPEIERETQAMQAVFA